ncbi:hypothetical protein Pint_24566 [Pistacia integerrima]|uniref:Uncharacterized protein n=1 Tax=Pistacia integerrima TaxID=434235 RepID=A0ACC0YHD6_9ROSI|nr:hypothetical protein Pint_24566 [Pistacia integerrima]
MVNKTGINPLSNLLQSSEKAINAIKGSPCILDLDLQKWIAPKGSRFEEVVDLVKEMGINPKRSQFVIAVYIMLLLPKSKWDKKIDVYRRWGWSEEEILTTFRKNPWFMITSVDKIMRMMDHFVNKMGWEPSIILKQSNLLSLSLEKRIVPRGSVLQYLSSKGLLKNNPYNPVTSFKLPEETFLQRFVNCYDEAPQLMKLYREAGSYKDGKVKGKRHL